MKIGSHVSMSAPDYVLGAVKETLSYHANACMLYTGAPQNTRRKAISELKIKEAHTLMEINGIEKANMMIHAPYIINLANCLKPEIFELGVSFLEKEIERVQAFGASTLILHPGSHVKAGEEAGLLKIIEGLDLAMAKNRDVKIALETMSGKGSEIGYQFEQIRYIMDHAVYADQLYVCMDTCHIHDAGYDLQDFDSILEHFDQCIGLDRLICMHINDSKNILGAKKDRHANIGFGEIGFDALQKIVHHPRLQDVVKILETPYVEGHAPYKHEIAMLMNREFNPNILTDIQNNT